MSFWFRTYREHSDDPQNSMIAQIYRQLLTTRSEVVGGTTAPNDLERKRVDIIPSESYVIIVTGNCFVKAAARPVSPNFVHYSMDEPDASKLRCWYEFDYRSNRLSDKSIRGNHALLKGLPKIVSYQPEYPSSSIKLDGTTSYVDMGNTSNLRLCEGIQYSLSFDGSNDYVQLGNDATLWSQSLTKFSFSFWAYATAGFDGVIRTYVQHGQGTAQGFSCYLSSSTSNRINFQIRNAANTQIIAFNTNFDLFKLHHVLCVYDNSLVNANLKIYVDGVVGTNADLTEAINLSTNMTIADPSSLTFCSGRVRDIRWWTTTARTAGDATALNNGTYAGTAPNYWLKTDEGKNNPIDFISNTKTAVLTNGTSWTNVSKRDEITIAAWVYFTSNPASAADIVTRGQTQSWIMYVDTDGKLKAQFFYRDGTNAILDSTVVGTGGWHRVMICHSDTNDISKIWVDGVLKASNSKNGFLRNSGGNAGDRFMIGAKPTGASTQSNFLAGNVDDVKVWARELEDTEALADFNGDYVSPVELVSEWDFDEDEHATKAVDSQSYNTGTINAGVFDSNNVPFILSAPYPYRDGVTDYLMGYKTTGEEHLIIPELSNDFRITGLTVGGRTYEWVVKLSTFDRINGRLMTLLYKGDDFSKNYGHAIRIGTDGHVYVYTRLAGVTYKIRTVSALKLSKLYRIAVGYDYDAFGGVDPLVFNKIYLNGFSVPIEVTTEDSELPSFYNEPVNDFHTYIGTTHIPLKGNYVGQIYSFRYYEEDIAADRMLALQTNKFTKRSIDKGHVTRSNLTKLYETNKNREVIMLPDSAVSDLFEYFLTDTQPTARFSTSAADLAIADDFDFTLSVVPIKLGKWSADFSGNDWIEIPTIDPVRKNFSISVWVKYDGNVGGWGGIISRIDGMPNGNRLMVTSTAMRWHAKYGDASDPFVNYEVTIPSITGVWHHIMMTYDGEDTQRLKLFLDGHMYLDMHQEHQIKGGDDDDNGKTYIGKGADDNYFLDGKLDELVIYDRTVTDAEVRSLAAKKPILTGIMAHYDFENELNDIENGDFNGSNRGATFSTDTP